MLITRFLSYNFTQETLILAGATIYVAIRFGLSHFLRHYTVHRGMFHSIPSMAIFGEMTYLLFYGESMFVRLFMVAAVCLGFFSHLLLDEIYSVEWDGRPHLKNSFGTALKFVGRDWWPNFTCYTKLAAMTFLVMNDPSVIHQIYTGQGQDVAKNLGQAVKDRFDSALAQAQSKTSGGLAALAQIPGGSASRPASLPAGSASTVPPPSFAWPGAATTAAVAPVAPQSMGGPPSPAGSFPSSTSPASNLTSPPGNAAQPADIQPWSTAPSRPAAGARFWQ
jgi:hypothetical protein